MWRRSLAQLLAFATLLLSASSVFPLEVDSPMESSSSAARVATQDGEVTITDLEISGVQRVVKIWPTELYWGDNIYCCCYDYNDSDAPFAYVNSDRNEEVQIRVELVVPGTKIARTNGFQLGGPRSYSLHPEANTTYFTVFDPTTKKIKTITHTEGNSEQRLDDILPNGRSIAYASKYSLSIPNDDESFQEYRSLFKDGDVTVGELSVSISDFNTDGAPHKQYNYKLPVRIKKRYDSELRLLSAWESRSKAFQEYAKSVHLTPNEKKSSELWKLRCLANFGYDRYSFLEMSEERWADFESLLQPCNVRDEITYGKTLVSYYTEKDDARALAKRNELVSWLTERPEPQLFSLMSRFYWTTQFFTETFQKSHTDLLDEIYRRVPTANLRRFMTEQLKHPPKS